MKKVIYIVISVVLCLLVFKILSKNPATTGADEQSADLVLYWGEGCPHCEKVKKYIIDNKIDQKIKITYKEVYYNKTNQNDLEKTAQKCPEIDQTKGIGVPLAFDTKNQQCLLGDTPIIDWINKF